MKLLYSLLACVLSVSACLGQTITEEWHAGTPTENGSVLRSTLSRPSDISRKVAIGEGRYDLGSGFALVRGATDLQGAGRDRTLIVGHGAGHSAFACVVEIAGPSVTISDMTLQWSGGRGSQAQVVGYGSKSAPNGGTFILNRCDIEGQMFSLYSWPGQGNTIIATDCTIRAARFPITAGNSSGANGQFIDLYRCHIICDSSLHDQGRSDKGEKYRTAYCIYARGGTTRCWDCTFEATGDGDMAAVLGIGIPAEAALGTRVELVRPTFKLNGNGAGRVAETESLQPGATILIDGIDQRAPNPQQVNE